MTGEDLEVSFEPIAAALAEFSRRRNLLFDKRPHEAPTWGLCFADTKGGQAKFDLSRQ